MATAKEQAGSSRQHELKLIINELEALNEEVRANDIWIRTRWNLPNQTAWHLGSADQPSPSAHSLTVEYPSPRPHVWRWGDIEPYLLKLAELCPLELTERQSVLLTNPAFGLTGVKVTNTMRIAISIYKRGDDAESHLHTPNASRTIISDSGGYTIVEGEKMQPKRGDLVFTPNGTWHEHGNDDDSPVIWADTLDWPLIDFLGCAWARSDTENAVPHGDPAEDFSKRFYGRGGIRPLFAPHHRGSGQGNSPMFLYSGVDIRGALDDLSRYDGDPHEGIAVELVNPENGAPVFTTISYRAQLLRPGEATRPFPPYRVDDLLGRRRRGHDRGRRRGDELGAQRLLRRAQPPLAALRQHRHGERDPLQLHRPAADRQARPLPGAGEEQGRRRGGAGVARVLPRLSRCGRPSIRALPAPFVMAGLVQAIHTARPAYGCLEQVRA